MKLDHKFQTEESNICHTLGAALAFPKPFWWKINISIQYPFGDPYRYDFPQKLIWFMSFYRKLSTVSTNYVVDFLFFSLLLYFLKEQFRFEIVKFPELEIGSFTILGSQPFYGLGNSLVLRISSNSACDDNQPTGPASGLGSRARSWIRI